MAKKVIYYDDELNNDFSGITRKDIKFSDDYKYIHKNIFYRFFAFIVYRIIMTPVAFIYTKLKFKIKFVGKEKLKEVDGAYFIYANHTLVPGDGYIPNVLTFPKRNFVVVGKDNLALKGTRTFMKMVGAFLVPQSIKMTRNFVSGISYYLDKGSNIVIYPEAHIWPYYTKIRPFKQVSFSYPVKFNKPSFAMCVTYQKRKHSPKPRITVYVDGPFYPNLNGMSSKEAQVELHKKIYDSLVKFSENSTYEYYEYRKKEDN